MRASMAVVGALSVAVAACDGSQVSPTVIAGPYSGTWNEQSARILVLDDGRFYVRYMKADIPSALAGVVAGTIASIDGKVAQGSGIDYNYGEPGVTALTWSGMYAAGQTIAAKASYADGRTAQLNARYDSHWARATLVAATGSFCGVGMTHRGTQVDFDAVRFTVDAKGEIAGLAQQCQFSGTLAPRVSSNVYDATLNFDGGAGCAYPNTPASGFAMMRDTQLEIFVQTPDKSSILLVMEKQ
ncbi:unnamed protein product [Mycetohabitans rhizoxinica HKI 454]|uniref:Lipoprotein n=2 Tax=Mycetohabitans rhizoxinica TaxID=412963 RepID=E5AL90_MYCRK|nr:MULTISPECIES: hypothetical protein [Mycetohabitans]MCG1046073.1 hypothetical protein [Mycetohabitans sp. B6]CBW73763.1 unnamed protein product [Mycetohabitans rhizoxinica HKI 454]